MGKIAHMGKYDICYYQAQMMVLFHYTQIIRSVHSEFWDAEC